MLFRQVVLSPDCRNFSLSPEYFAEARHDANCDAQGERQQDNQYQGGVPFVSEVITQGYGFRVSYRKAQQYEKQRNAQEPHQITHDSFLKKANGGRKSRRQLTNCVPVPVPQGENKNGVISRSRRHYTHPIPCIISVFLIDPLSHFFPCFEMRHVLLRDSNFFP